MVKREKEKEEENSGTGNEDGQYHLFCTIVCFSDIECRNCSFLSCNLI